MLTAGFYLNVKNPNQSDGLYMKENASPDKNKELKQNASQQGVSELNRPTEGLSTLIGKQVDVLVSSYGEPNRKDVSSYGYEWWIYDDVKGYMQVGVENGKIVTLYAIGEKVNITPFKIGQSVEDLFSKVIFDAGVNFTYEETSYRFEMSEDEMNTRPLVKLGDIYVQLLIDKFTGELSSVRFFNEKTLVTQRPYELVYRGELLENEPLSDDSWRRIEEGSKQQIFDITNIMRRRYHVKPLKWDEATAEVAFLHSKDMYDSNTFTHNSKLFGELSDRLKTANIQYQIAGENIAANYMDAPAVMEGWLNSEGHRDSLLNDKYTHIGVGVFHKHYTQDFIQK
jgi:uncharacterized protein YkwD